MYNKTISRWIKTGKLPEIVLLMGIFVFLILIQGVSGAMTGTTVITGNVLLSPVAQFSANITGGNTPLIVQFTDESARDPIYWNWDFGDGINSTDQNPMHTYTTGVYTVNLTVTNAAGSSTSTAERYITVTQGQASASQPASSGSGGGGGGGSSGLVQQLAQGNPLGQMLAPAQNPSRGEQLAPPQGNLVSWTIDLSPYSGFMYIDSSDRPNAVINRGLERAQAERSGATISISGKTMEITRQGFSLTITAGTMNEANGIIQAENIQSIQLATAPFETYVAGLGPVTSSFTAGLHSLPPNAAITTIIGEPVTPEQAEIFRLAVADMGDKIDAIAYTMTVQKTNIAGTLPATITMSVPADWVTVHGGINAIVIGRIADDQTCTILETAFTGYDKSGNMEFVARSPNGLSVFGIMAAKGPLQARIAQSGLRAPVQQATIPVTISGVMSNILHTIGELGIVILVVAIIVVIAACVTWRTRRIHKPEKKEKK